VTAPMIGDPLAIAAARQRIAAALILAAAMSLLIANREMRRARPRVAELRRRAVDAERACDRLRTDRDVLAQHNLRLWAELDPEQRNDLVAEREQAGDTVHRQPKPGHEPGREPGHKPQPGHDTDDQDLDDRGRGE
jgi:hypothetical protein